MNRLVSIYMIGAPVGFNTERSMPDPSSLLHSLGIETTSCVLSVYNRDLTMDLRININWCLVNYVGCRRIGGHRLPLMTTFLARFPRNGNSLPTLFR